MIKTGHLSHVSDGGTRNQDDLMPETVAEPAEVRKGGVVFLSQYTPHRSTPNLTEWDVALEPGPAVRSLWRAYGKALLSRFLRAQP